MNQFHTFDKWQDTKPILTLISKVDGYVCVCVCGMLKGSKCTNIWNYGMRI